MIWDYGDLKILLINISLITFLICIKLFMYDKYYNINPKLHNIFHNLLKPFLRIAVLSPNILLTDKLFVQILNRYINISKKFTR